MKKSLFLLIIALYSISANAQFVINPQAGINVMNLSKPPEGTQFSGVAGVLAGVDMRIGTNYFIQPGIYLNRSTTAVKYTNVDTITYNNNLYRTSVKLKALFGSSIIDLEAFKFRYCFGPSYDFLLAINNKYTDQPTNTYSKNNFKNGTFNLEAGLGFDFWIITLEGGYIFGLTNALKDQGNNHFDSKYSGLYLTAGVTFGDAHPKKKGNNDSNK